MIMQMGSERIFNSLKEDKDVLKVNICKHLFRSLDERFYPIYIHLQNLILIALSSLHIFVDELLGISYDHVNCGKQVH